MTSNDGLRYVDHCHSIVTWTNRHCSRRGERYMPGWPGLLQLGEIALIFSSMNLDKKTCASTIVIRSLTSETGNQPIRANDSIRLELLAFSA